MSLAPPDLSSDAGRAAYRAELRRVALWPRLAGLGVVAGAVLVTLWNISAGGPHNRALTTACWVALGLGWTLLIVAIFMRSRYHRRRLRGL